MQTFLNPEQHPYVRLTFAGNAEDVVLDCLIDTGFAGGVSIPMSLKERFDFPRIGRQTWELADGSQVELEVFLGAMKTKIGKKELAVIFTDGGEGLVGIEFLRGKKFILNLKNSTVVLS